MTHFQKMLKNTKLSTLWVVSYVFIFVLPMFAVLGVYFTGRNNLVDIATLSIAQTAQEQNSAVVKLYSQCNVIYHNIVEDSLFKMFSSISSADEFPEFSVFEMQQRLKAAQSGDRFYINEIALVYNRPQYIIATSRAGDFQYFYDAQFASDRQRVKEEIENMRGDYDGIFKKTDNGFSYIKTYKTSDNTVNVVVNINDAILRQADFNIYEEGISVFLFNKNMELFFSNGRHESTLVSDLIRVSESGISVIDKTKYLLHCNTVYNIKFISMLPYDRVVAVAFPLKVTMLLSCFISLIVGILSIRFFMNKNLIPIRNIYKLVTNSGNSMSVSAYDVIEEKVAAQKREHSALVRTVNIIKPVMVSEIVSGIVLRGSVKNAAAKLLNVDFDKCFYVILVKIEDLGVFSDHGKYDADLNKELLFMAVSNIVCEVMEEAGKAFCCDIDDCYAVVINTDRDQTENILLLAEKAYSFIKSHLQVSARIVCSLMAKSINDVPDIYSNALDKMSYMEYNDDYGIFNIDEASFSLENEMILYGNFSNYVLSGDEEKALKTILDILKLSFSFERNAMISKLTDLFSRTLNILSQIDENETEALLKNNDIFAVIAGAKKLFLVKDKIVSFTKKMCEIPLSKGENNSLESRVADFIRDNYADYRLNVKYISDTFGITPSYLTQRFKRGYGVSILEYLNSVRIDRACGLLRETNETVEYILGRCGFISFSTFLRQFKKNVGISPNEYRQLFKSV